MQDAAGGQTGTQVVRQVGEVLWVASEESDGHVAMGWVGEDAGYAGALGFAMSSARQLRLFCGAAGALEVGGSGCGRTLVGPAPMRIARPFGAILKVLL